MCIIFYNQHGNAYNERELRNAAAANEDGAGIMWIENGKVRTFHCMIEDGDQLVKLMKDFDGIPHMLHLRYATHGDPSEKLCHPFRATNDDADKHVWLMHNGVLTQHAKMASKTESDTLVFAKQMRQVVKGYGSSEILYDERYINHLEKVIDGDRMIFLRDDGHVVVLNPGKWYRDKESGIWYSNLYSIAERPRWNKPTYHSVHSYGYMGGHDFSDWDDKFGTDDTAQGSGVTPVTEKVFGPVNKSAAESAKVFEDAFAPSQADGPLLAEELEVDEDDEVFYFRWDEDHFVICKEEDSDIEVDAEEFWDHCRTVSADALENERQEALDDFLFEKIEEEREDDAFADDAPMHPPTRVSADIDGGDTTFRGWRSLLD
jgi:hypothetical protein